MGARFDQLLLYLILVLQLISSAASTCTVPYRIQGQWDIMDAARARVEHSVDITSSGLSGMTFWNKTLSYDCFFQRDNYYVWRSEQTALFDQYNVKLYFCWYLLGSDGGRYKLYELTDKVLYTIEERAKAYLDSITPDINQVCEIGFQTSLTYKQMDTRASTETSNF